MARLNSATPCSDPITGGSFSAHGRTCTETGDRIHVSYAYLVPPFARVDIFSPEAKSSAESTGWNLKQSIPVNLPTGTPVMLHDCAITSNYALVVIFPLTIRPRKILLDRFPVEYEPANGARIGLVPRRGTETRIPRPNPIFAGLIAILA
jgi:carotenoid cleavage dioxygenase-like enzyme